jgi:O-acetyl-ADP-ribose deacetylase (regulator of RNase III)
MEDIDSGLVGLVNVITNNRIRSIAIPALGSGLGRLDWSDVRPRIETALAAVPDVHALVFEPQPGGTTRYVRTGKPQA